MIAILISPLEILIKRYFKQKAIKKIRKFPHITKIGITGSFGKTSCKNILYQILSYKYLTMKTPASFNTMMGLSKTINESSLVGVEIMLFEMGAFRLGEIKEMTEAIQPNIAIITEIGPQHISTFKTIDNIIKAKFEITNNLNNDDILIVNTENSYIRNYLKEFNKCNIYTYGINYGEYLAKNISFKDGITTFDIYQKNQFLISLSTKLLGFHSVLNILVAYVTIIALRKRKIVIDDVTFKKAVLSLEATKHRLEHYAFNHFHIYDDSFSSNIVGFKNAIAVLIKQKGFKVIITPGIVDAGTLEKTLNQEIASYLDSFDLICLIKNIASTYITEYLDAKSIAYLQFKSFKEAYSYVITKYNNMDEQVNILIENDLPDSFLER